MEFHCSEALRTENMASYDRSYEKDEVQHQRVHVGKDHVDFSYQFMKKCSTKYSSRNYKISTSWQERPRTYLLKEPHNDSSDFYICIDLVFDEAVYPIRVSIYEMRFPLYNTKIWAHNSQENRWFLLWTGKCQTFLPDKPQLFSPPLQFCDFKTKRLKLTFLYNFLEYDWNKTSGICLSDVMLIGTSKLILSKNSEGIFTSILKSVKNHHLINDNFTPIGEHAHWDIRHLQKNFSNYCTIYTSNSHSNHAQITKYSRLSLDNSEKHTRCGFSTLPDEMILKILKYLDIKSLCHMSTMNKHFNNLTRDGSLFKCLNLLNLHDMSSVYKDNIISYFTSRCKYLQKLDLTSSDISSSELKKFLEICGGSLTHLRLSNCTLYSNVLDEIAALCNNLQVLDLSYCIFEDLLNEPILSADVTLRVCKLLQRNPRICNLNLNRIGYLFENIDDSYYLPGFNCMDSIAIQLRDSCADLKILNISDCPITSLGIDALAECKSLRKLNIPNMNNGTIDTSCLSRMFSICQSLEEINMMYPYYDADKFLTLCKNLKQVYLEVLPLTVLTLPLQCSKLQKISFMEGDEELIHRMEQEYPQVSLCKLEY